jgi:hypothetical protein
MFFIFYPSRIVLTILFLIVITIQGVEISIAHSGGTDSFGCHAGSKPYHCHGGPDNSNNTDYIEDFYDMEEPIIYRSTKNNSNEYLLYSHLALSCLFGVIGYYNRKYDISHNNNFNKKKLGPAGFGFFCFFVSHILLLIFASPEGIF